MKNVCKFELSADPYILANGRYTYSDLSVAGELIVRQSGRETSYDGIKMFPLNPNGEVGEDDECNVGVARRCYEQLIDGIQMSKSDYFFANSCPKREAWRIWCRWSRKLGAIIKGKCPEWQLVMFTATPWNLTLYYQYSEQAVFIYVDIEISTGIRLEFALPTYGSGAESRYILDTGDESRSLELHEFVGKTHRILNFPPERCEWLDEEMYTDDPPDLEHENWEDSPYDNSDRYDADYDDNHYQGPHDDDVFLREMSQPHL